MLAQNAHHKLETGRWKRWGWSSEGSRRTYLGQAQQGPTVFLPDTARVLWCQAPSCQCRRGAYALQKARDQTCTWCRQWRRADSWQPCQQAIVSASSQVADFAAQFALIHLALLGGATRWAEPRPAWLRLLHTAALPLCGRIARGSRLTCSRIARVISTGRHRGRGDAEAGAPPR